MCQPSLWLREPVPLLWLSGSLLIMQLRVIRRLLAMV